MTQRDDDAGTRSGEDARIDWAAIEREYRADQLSTREIARNYAVSEAAIRKRAKGDGKRSRWVKDLAPLVRAETDRRILEATAAGEPPADGQPAARVRPPTTREIIDAAAMRATDVVLSHRKHIVGLRQRVTELAVAYDALADHLRADQLSGDTKEQKAAFYGLANGLDQLVGVSSALIGLERQAFGLDKGEAERPAGNTLTPEQRAAGLRAVRARMAALEGNFA